MTAVHVLLVLLGFLLGLNVDLWLSFRRLGRELKRLQRLQYESDILRKMERDFE